ncbi:hypothetical protein [Intestinibacter sp.]|uniref:hypothetical protein n=1 Tax=Intestinibacter sp. TaxID=1965304 RepID=UPI002A754D73|nr:hypothetical protein [Intestinibacter sp.]MDY2737110.1 hypothetical protein [Intestinibacter sp.]
MTNFINMLVGKGISISPFLQAKMQEFIKEEKEFEEYKKLKKEGKLNDLIDTK